MNPATAPDLELQWDRQPGYPGGTTQPIDAGGVLYWSDWDGMLHATSESTQTDPWRCQLGSTYSSCENQNQGSRRHADGGNGERSLHRLPRRRDRTDCPLVPGELFRLDATTGAIEATFVAVPSGCTGATIWSSPTVDDSTGELFVDTGNGDGTCPEPEPYQEAMIRLDPTTLAVQDSWQTQPNSNAGDADLGATPTLFTATIAGQSVPMVGAMNKNGYYYAFRRDDLAAGPVWTQYFAKTGDTCVVCGETMVASSA